MSSVVARIQAVGELREAMIAMQRQLLVRLHPEESPSQIDRRLADWVVSREPPHGTAKVAAE